MENLRRGGWTIRTKSWENVSDKSEDLTDVYDSSEDNVPDSMLTQQLLFCPVTSEDFLRELVSYPRKICKRRDSDTDSKLRQRFLDLRTEAFGLQSLQRCQQGTLGYRMFQYQP
jgi:hypothetical protein